MPGPPDPAAPFRAALMMPGWLGDCVMASALIDPLAERSGGPIQLWCRPAHRELFEGDPAIGEVLVYDPKGEHRGLGGLARWRKRCRAAEMSPEYLWIVPDSLSAALGARASGVKHRVGRVGQGRDLLLTERCPMPPRRFRHWIDEQAALLPPGGAEPKAVLSPRIHLPEGAAASIATRLGEMSLHPDDLCVLVPGATYGPAKRWTGFADFVRLLPEGIMPVLVGSSEEGPLTGEIATEIREGGRDCLDLAGALGLGELGALMAAVRFVLSNDTGPMHLAAAVGARVLGLFLSTDPVWTAPRGARVRHLASDVVCRPCFDRRCSMTEMICAEGIDAWALRGALAEWLEPGSEA
jgi:heptosyltransferase II